MSGPWEKYQAASPVADGPWAKYGAPKVDPATMQPAGVPAFVPPGVEGYNPKTGEVAPSTLSDVVDSGASGIRQGIEASIAAAGDAANQSGNIASWAAQKFGASPETAATVGSVAKRLNPWFGMAPSSNDVQAVTDKVAGPAYQPQTTAGEYARTVGQFAPAALLPNGEAGIAQRLFTQALLPGVGSETAGQLTKGTDLEPYARFAGGLAGGLAPSVARRAVTPFPNSPEREALARTLANEGVDLTAGQRTGSNMLRYSESELGGGAAANMMDRQGEQFTSAVLQRAGINANRATPEVIDGAFNRIGQQFDDLAARNTLVPDQQLVGDLRSTINDYGNLVPESARAPIVENLTNDIVGTIRRNGQIPGDSYQALTSRIARAARGTQDPQLGDALHGIRGALDDAMARSIQANNPADAGAWQEARNQYRNLLVIEKAATGAGENAAAGLISPSSLRNATVQQSRRAYARGQGDFADLARAGEGVMKPLPNSGSASRAAVRGAFSTLGGIAGAASGGGWSGGGLGALAGAIVPPLAGRAILSGPGRAYLGNQAAANMTTLDPRRAALIAALFSQQPHQ